MTKSEYAKKQIEICRAEWFGEHRATVVADVPDVRLLGIRWGKPTSSNYATNYLILGGTLYVSGDIGEAVYRFGSTLNREFIKDMNWDYFSEKCCASEKGRDYEGWNRDVAHANLQEQLAQMDAESGFEDGKDEPYHMETFRALSRPEKEECEEAAREWYDATGDSEFASVISSAGNVPDCRCIGHLIGLQMAFEQLAQRKPEPTATIALYEN